MICPNCQHELVTSERQNVQIDHCPNCQGVWLDRGELEKILQMDASGGRQSEATKGRDDDDDDTASRKRGSSDNADDDDDDDDRGTSRSRDRDDDDDRSGADRGTTRSRERGDDYGDAPSTGRGGSYGNRDRGSSQRGGDGGDGHSLWRDIFDNLAEKIPNLADKLPRP
jgi:Zn-finger nucleic acid-binding protein